MGAIQTAGGRRLGPRSRGLGGGPLSAFTSAATARTPGSRRAAAVPAKDDQTLTPRNVAAAYKTRPDSGHRGERPQDGAPAAEPQLTLDSPHPRILGARTPPARTYNRAHGVVPAEVRLTGVHDWRLTAKTVGDLSSHLALVRVRGGTPPRRAEADGAWCQEAPTRQAVPAADGLNGRALVATADSSPRCATTRGDSAASRRQRALRVYAMGGGRSSLNICASRD